MHFICLFFDGIVIAVVSKEAALIKFTLVLLNMSRKKSILRLKTTLIYSKILKRKLKLGSQALGLYFTSLKFYFKVQAHSESLILGVWVGKFWFRK